MLALAVTLPSPFYTKTNRTLIDLSFHKFSFLHIPQHSSQRDGLLERIGKCQKSCQSRGLFNLSSVVRLFVRQCFASHNFLLQDFSHKLISTRGETGFRALHSAAQCPRPLGFLRTSRTDHRAVQHRLNLREFGRC